MCVVMERRGGVGYWGTQCDTMEDVNRLGLGELQHTAVFAVAYSIRGVWVFVLSEFDGSNLIFICLCHSNSIYTCSGPSI
jgi:hypothetical protein